MEITINTIKKLGNLAHIALTDESEWDQYQGHLTKLFNLIEKINQVETEKVIPMAHPLDTYQRLRADEVTEENVREDMQKIAPCPSAIEAGLYLVPPVIDDQNHG